MSESQAPGRPPADDEQESRAPTAPASSGASRRWLAHIAAIALLFAVLALRYPHLLTFPDILNDEISYTHAARRVAAGQTPYYGGYLYTPLVAVAVAAAQERWGLLPVLIALRSLNFVGVAVTAWIALLPLPWNPVRRWLTCALYLAFAPAVHFTLQFSNLSGLVVGAISIGLTAWPAAPLAAGLLLGTSLAVKPLAPGALAVLLAHRPAGLGRRHLATVAVAGIVAALLILPLPYLGDMLSVPASTSRQLIRTVSPHRIAYLLGWRNNAVPLSAALLLAAMWVSRRRPWTPPAVALLAAVTAIAATPIVWSHSLLLTLPLQVLALDRAWSRWQDGRRSSRRRRLLYEGVFVSLGAAAIQFAQGAHGIYDRGLVLQLAGAALPAFSPAALAAYVLATRPPASPSHEAQRPGSADAAGIALNCGSTSAGPIPPTLSRSQP